MNVNEINKWEISLLFNLLSGERANPWGLLVPQRGWGGGRKGEQGWRSGESTRLPPMWPGFESWRRRHMWVEFVVGSILCSDRFFFGSGFSLSLKTNTFKFQFDLERTDTFQRVLMNSLVLRGYTNYKKYSGGTQNAKGMRSIFWISIFSVLWPNFGNIRSLGMASWLVND